MNFHIKSKHELYLIMPSPFHLNDSNCSGLRMLENLAVKIVEMIASAKTQSSESQKEK